MCPEIWQFLELRNNFVYDYKDENVHIFTKILLILRKFTLKFTFEVVNIYFVCCCFKGIYSAFSPSAIKAKARINPKWPLTFPNNKADYLEDWGSSQTQWEKTDKKCEVTKKLNNQYLISSFTAITLTQTRGAVWSGQWLGGNFN